MLWERTRAALAEYDSTAAERNRMLDTAETNEAVAAWTQVSVDAVDTVQGAFYEDCVEQGVPNSRDHCRVVTIRWLRELVRERTVV